MPKSEAAWLVVTDLNGESILESHEIRPYEVATITLKEGWDVFQESADSKEVVLENVSKRLFEEEPMSWEEITSLVGDYSGISVEKGETLEDTVDSLLPTHFPEDIQEQLKVFLAWVVRKGLPAGDVVAFMQQFRGLTALSWMLGGHLSNLLAGNKTYPPYVKILHQETKTDIESLPTPITTPNVHQPWMKAYYRLRNIWPDTNPLWTKHAQRLNETGIRPMGLPVSAEEAEDDMQKKRERLALFFHSIMARGHVFPEPMGLVRAVYLGRAHTWPSQFTAWSARVQPIYETHTPIWLQVMFMPEASFRRAQRSILGLEQITLYSESHNLDLYESKWNIAFRHLRDWMAKSSTANQLKSDAGIKEAKKQYFPTEEEAKVLDLLHPGLFLMDLEPNLGVGLGMDASEIWHHASELEKAGILKVGFLGLFSRTLSLLSIANGERENLYSMLRGFIRHTPTSSFMLSKDHTECKIISRVPEDAVYDFITRVPEMAAENDIELQVLGIIQDFRTYTYDLFRRLRVEDGVWQKDVTEITSQVSIPHSKEDL
jgi:hypothetical protein